MMAIPLRNLHPRDTLSAERFIHSLLLHCTRNERGTHLRDELKGLRLGEKTSEAHVFFVIVVLSQSQSQQQLMVVVVVVVAAEVSKRSRRSWTASNSRRRGKSRSSGFRV